MFTALPDRAAIHRDRHWAAGMSIALRTLGRGAHYRRARTPLRGPRRVHHGESDAASDELFRKLAVWQARGEQSAARLRDRESGVGKWECCLATREGQPVDAAQWPKFLVV